MSQGMGNHDPCPPRRQVYPMSEPPMNTPDTSTDANSSKLAELIALAREPSSAKRRELLREVTDLFFISQQPHSMRQLHLFDGVMETLASEMEQDVRAELAERVADADPDQAPLSLLRSLVADDIKVAAPVLTRSTALTEQDLLHVVNTKGQDHLRAVSQRTGLTESISDVIVQRGDDSTLGVLLRNESAPLSRKAAEVVVDRATANPDLHEAVIDRHNLPIDLLNEMYFVVEAQLRDRIMARNASLDVNEVQAALESSRKRLAARDGALPVDYAAAETHIRYMKAKGPITPSQLVGFLRHGERTRFLVALSELTEVDFHTARRIVEHKQLDALAICCKAADFDRTLFLTFAVLILDNGEGMARAQEYGALYNNLPKETAQRTLRFWRIRRDAGDVAAA